jgi:hypothetical protein
MTIPKRTWELDNEWNALGFEISRKIRNKFMLATSIGGHEGAQKFAEEVGDCERWFRCLLTDSICYIEALRKGEPPEDSPKD